MKNEELKMKNENTIQIKSYKFALRMIKLHNYLRKEKKEFVISKQVLKSGTSIGANVEEAIGAQSKPDFIAKAQIALKESRETHYWLRLLFDSGYLEKKLAVSLIAESEELIKILSSILITSKSSKI
jgi:four helix bundle protein